MNRAIAFISTLVERGTWYNSSIEFEHDVGMTALDGEALLEDAHEIISEEYWNPSSFGGSTAVAGQLGLLAMFAARAGYDDTAYKFARWAAREALQFFDVMDKKQKDGTQFELWRNHEGRQNEQN